MSKIRHPNCVRLFGNFEDENFCYFIMEYIPGGNLYTLMSSNRNTGLNIYLVANIVRDLASAIYYLHNMNPPISTSKENSVPHYVVRLYISHRK